MPVLSTQQSIAFGVFLIILGLSFAYKGYEAMVKGKLLIWQGFLPFTMLSPFINHLPPRKNSLLKYKEGMWIHVIMGPLFLLLTVLFIAAGGDFVGYPATDNLNFFLTGGRLGAAPMLMFSKRTGYQFPFGPRLATAFGKMMSGKIEMKGKDRMVEDESGSQR
jgi:hypothetical protein